jgi:RimJ/RimL family protein N-acetyltransferase
MLEFSTENYHFMTFDPNRLDHLKAKMYLNTDLDIRRYLGDSIKEFLESPDQYSLNDAAFLVSRNDKIIGYVALFDYYRYLDMHYALLGSARGFVFSKTESTGTSLIKETSSAIFKRTPALDFIKLYINKNNINSMRAAQNAGFKLYGEVAYYNFEYRKYRP